MARVICRTFRSCLPSTPSTLTGPCRSRPDQDEEIVRNLLREREAAKRREEEAREREAELARQRLEQERLAREEEGRRQVERERVLEKRKGVGRGASRTVDPSSSGVRGVRGTRASMRARGAATGSTRGGADSLSKSNTVLIPSNVQGATTTSGPGKTGIPRPSSSTSTRIPSRGRGRP